MELDEIEAWQAVEHGETKFTWDLWFAAIERSGALTAEGKWAVRSAAPLSHLLHPTPPLENTQNADG
ncbi:MAG: hypothetical protein ABSB09_09070 [Acidimicrobiales bacterium]